MDRRSFLKRTAAGATLTLVARPNLPGPFATQPDGSLSVPAERKPLVTADEPLCPPGLDQFLFRWPGRTLATYTYRATRAVRIVAGRVPGPWIGGDWSGAPIPLQAHDALTIQFETDLDADRLPDATFVLHDGSQVSAPAEIVERGAA